MQVYEACLSLIHALACGEASAPPMLRFLALQPSSFAPLLDAPLQLLASQQVQRKPADSRRMCCKLCMLAQLYASLLACSQACRISLLSGVGYIQHAQPCLLCFVRLD